MGARSAEAWTPGKADRSTIRKPFVKRQKNDAGDAEAIVIAVDLSQFDAAPLPS